MNTKYLVHHIPGRGVALEENGQGRGRKMPMFWPVLRALIGIWKSHYLGRVPSLKKGALTPEAGSPGSDVGSVSY